MTNNPSGHSADCSANNTDAVPDQRINDPRYSDPDAPLSTAQVVERLREWIADFVRGNEAADPPLEGKAIEVYESMLAFARALLSACEYILFLEEWPQLEGLDLPKALYSREQFRADVVTLLEGSDAGST